MNEHAQPVDAFVAHPDDETDVRAMLAAVLSAGSPELPVEEHAPDSHHGEAYVAMLHRAVRLDDLCIPTQNRLEALKGNRRLTTHRRPRATHGRWNMGAVVGT